MTFKESIRKIKTILRGKRIGYLNKNTEYNRVRKGFWCLP